MLRCFLANGDEVLLLSPQDHTSPELKNIVLLRHVNSMIEFKQTIDRGTRLYEGKDYFTVIS